MRARQVARPQTAAQSVVGAVGDRQRFVVGAKTQHGDERAEHFLLRDAVVRARRSTTVGSHVVAIRERRVVRRVAAGQHAAALLARDVDVGQHALAVLRRGERPHLGVGIERVAEPDRCGQRHEALEERVGDALVQDQPRAGDARLALVVEDRERGAVDRRVEVRVVEHDVRALAAQFELHALEVALRRLDDAPPRRRRAGERDLADAWVLGEPLPGRVRRSPARC